MDTTTVIFGYGPVGRLVAATLPARGEPVRIAQRRRCAVAGAAQVLLAVGFAYGSGAPPGRPRSPTSSRPVRQAARASC